MSWDQVACHHSVRKAILLTMEKGMFSGTHLIYGPRGAGQALVARAIAKSLFCRKQKINFCGECSACKRIQERIYPDVIEMMPETTVYKIDQLREMQYQALVQPYESELKLFILHDAHRMQEAAANSLLKILEEPYEHNLFILLTDNISQIIQTILSRCRKIRLSPLSIDILINDLKKTMDADAAETIARAAGGLPELAKEICENNYLEERDKILEMLLDIRKAESCIPEITNALVKRKTGLRELFSIILGIIRDGVLYTSASETGPFFHPDRKDKIMTLWKGERPEKMIQRFEKNLEALEGIDKNINAQFLLEDFFIAIRPS